MLEVCANIIETAMRAFSAIKLLFCSLAELVVAVWAAETAAAQAAAVAASLAAAADEAAAKSGEFLNNKAAV